MSGRRSEKRTVADLTGDGVYVDLDLSHQDLRHRPLENSRFERCSFVGADLTSARLNAGEFVGCDLSGARISGCNLFSASFVESKMLGLDFRDGVVLTATRFTRCRLDYTTFRGVSLKKISFARCSLVEADLSLTDLSHASFVDCDLSNVDLHEATLFMTDLRGATLSGWNVRRHDLAGIVISPAQCRHLIEELGIQVLEA